MPKLLVNLGLRGRGPWARSDPETRSGLVVSLVAGRGRGPWARSTPLLTHA